MGVEMVNSSPSNPLGHWEDLDFVRMNNEILAGAGGTWDNPPIEVDAEKLRPELVYLVNAKNHPEAVGGEPREGELWGWKDPRTCLTAACYHGWLTNPHYVIVDRDKEAVVASLEWREGRAGDRWSELYDLYMEARKEFVNSINAPCFWLRYEDLVREPFGNAQALADFLGLDTEAANAAAATVKPRSLDIPDTYVVNLSGGQVDAPDAKTRIVNAGSWPQGWKTVHGPVHGLVLDDTSDMDEARGWIPKVQPGGFVTGRGVRVMHDWPTTAWALSTQQNGPDVLERKPLLRAGDGWGTIGIGVPYFKPCYDFWRWWSWMLLQGLEPGDQFLNDDSVVAPLPIPVVHNRLIARFLETDRDTLCIVEDDHVGDPQVIRQMREKPENRGFDIVCANYVNRRMVPAMTGYGIGRRNHAGEVMCVLDFDNVQRTGTQEVDGAAMGLVLIRRWVLEAMLDGGNPETTFWCNWHGTNSQDIQFYAWARELGARAGVDRDANIGHMAQTIRTVDDFWKMRGA